MVFDGIRELSNAVDYLILQTPDAGQFDVLYRLTGTWVGTIQCQRTADLKTFAAVTPRQINSGTSADATANGTYAARLTAADKGAKLIFSSYTSGTARIEAALVRV